MMCALSSVASWQQRHTGSRAGSTFDLWYLKKLCPVRCLMHNPRSVLFKFRSSFESFLFGSGKNIFVCLQSAELSHLSFHLSSVRFLARDLISLCGRGRNGAGPSTHCTAAPFASWSASSFPSYPSCPSIQRMQTCLFWLNLFNALTALNTVQDLAKCPETAMIADWLSLNIVTKSWPSEAA